MTNNKDYLVLLLHLLNVLSPKAVYAYIAANSARDVPFALYMASLGGTRG